MIERGQVFGMTAAMTQIPVPTTMADVNTNPENIVIGPRYFTEAFDAVMAAVNNGTLSEERINQSVRRILKLRKKINRAL